MNTAFHEGEQALQRLTGAYEQLAAIGPRVIRDHMPEQHREFFTQLPFVLTGSLDASGQPWAGVLAGPRGFIESPDARTLSIHARPLPHDPLAANLAAGAPIGLLGIEPHTRRRNRANGRVLQVDPHGLLVEVTQSFGNCPKYIQARRPDYTGPRGGLPVAIRAEALDARARDMISRADTFYIATAHPGAARGGERAQGVDVSHRGGRAGFVRVDGVRTLTVPDFAGNFFFNTLGNIAVHPLAGLLFMDFDSGDLLYLTARAQVVHDGPELAAFAGAQRLVRLQVRQMLRVPASLRLGWGPAQLSPHLAAIGAWPVAAGE